MGNSGHAKSAPTYQGITQTLGDITISNSSIDDDFILDAIELLRRKKDGFIKKVQKENRGFPAIWPHISIQ